MLLLHRSGHLRRVNGIFFLPGEIDQ